MATSQPTKAADDGSTSTKSAKECGFFDRLPPELQLEIYSHHMGDISEESRCRIQESSIANLKTPTSPLLATCKLIREEVRKPMWNCCLQIQRVLLAKGEEVLQAQRNDSKKAKAPTTDLGEYFCLMEELMVRDTLIDAWYERTVKLQKELDEDGKQLVAEGFEV